MCVKKNDMRSFDYGKTLLFVSCDQIYLSAHLMAGSSFASFSLSAWAGMLLLRLLEPLSSMAILFAASQGMRLRESSNRIRFQ